MASFILFALQGPPARAAECLARVLARPMMPAALLLAFVVCPEAARGAFLQRLPSAVTVDVIKRLLGLLIGLGVAIRANRGLSSMAANSWRATRAVDWHWPDEMAVVTGGCSGIGLAIVERLAGRGVSVAVLDIQETPKSMPPGVSVYKCDVTSPEAVAKAADAIRRDMGHPTILINNAGIAKPGSILDTPYETVRKVFDVNCLSHWTLVKQFLPHMLEANKGHIVTVASIASFLALSNAADYSASKAGALAFHETLAAELRFLHGSDGVVASVVHPSFVQTPLIDDFVEELEGGGIRLLSVDRVADEIAAQIFGGRGGQLIIPSSMTFLSGLRGWPTWAQVVARDVMGRISARGGHRVVG